MNKNSKRVLSIIVLTIFAMSFITLPSAFAAIDVPDLELPSPIYVGKEIRVYGQQGEVTSGAEVEIYWDIASGTNAHKIGSGYGAANGSYSVNVDIPEAVVGTHYIWVKDTNTVATAMSDPFTVVAAGITVSPSSGLPGDSVTVEGSDFPAETDVTVYFRNYSESAPYAVVYTWAGEKTVETDDLGSFSINYPVPTNPLPDYGPNYNYYATDGTNTAFDNYTVSASISLSETSGPAGNVLTINGRGFKNGAVLDTSDILVGTTHPYVIGDDVTVSSSGTFSVQIVIPSLDDDDGDPMDYDITVTDSIDPTVSGTTEYTLTGESAIEVNPTYGAPGATITVKGYNFTQIAGTDVEIKMVGYSPVRGTGKTTSSGTFETTFSVPAYAFDNYQVIGIDDSGLNATDPFKIGILALIITPTSGPSGTLVSVTGVGFNEDGDYNATLGDHRVITDGVISNQETLSDDFFVPTMAPGSYELAIVDDLGNELSVPYELTATTALVPSPVNVALTYNLSLVGTNFANQDTTALTWYVYNSTWWMKISAYVYEPDTVDVATTDADGEIDAYWYVIEDLILGNTYTINVTDNEGMYAEANITIVEEEVDIGPTKSSYALGEQITFKLKATFIKPDATLEIADPNGVQYFYSTFDNAYWTHVGDWWVVQVRNQVNDETLFPYVIPEDAETGAWSWVFVYSEDLNYTGTIEVVPATAAMLYDSIVDLAGQLTNVTDIVNGQQGAIGDIQSGLSALAATVAGNSDTLDSLSDQVASAVSQASSAVDAANQAVSAAQSATSAANQAASVAQDAVAAANSAKVEAQSAKTAALAAETAAKAAESASNGLGNLVYGAIIASLIAALAAIVSLMQINKRIAG